MKNALLLAALFLAACGGAPDAPLAVTSTLERPGASWASAGDLDARTEATIEAATEVWGAPGYSTSGVGVAFTDHLIDCSGVRAVGCATGAPGQGWLVQVLVTGAPCVEATTLPHELGHLVLGGDSRHQDPRWRDPAFWDAMDKALLAVSPSGDASCQEFLHRQGGLLAVNMAATAN